MSTETTAQLLERLSTGISAKVKPAQYSGIHSKSKKSKRKPEPEAKRHPWKGAK